MLVSLLIASAQISAAAPGPVATAPAEKPKMVCIREDEIGSRLQGKRVCHTQQEWDLIKQDARRSVESKQSSMNTVPGK